MSSIGFNPNFYSPREKFLFKRCQNICGCFHCGSPGATRTCSACHFAVYCNRECQKAHWKGACKDDALPHKEICKDITHRLRRPNARPVPMHLRAFGFITSDDVIEEEMRIFGDMFMDELVRIGVKSIGLQVFCFDDGDDVVRFNGTASFFSDGRVQTVNYVMFFEVDKGAGAVRNVEHMGIISDKAKERVLEHIKDFKHRLQGKGLSIANITLGTGLMWYNGDKI